MAKLPDRVSDRIRARQDGIRTEGADTRWIERFIFFDGRRHPQETGAPEPEASLTHRAADRNIAPPTRDQAPGAMLSLDRELPGLAARGIRPDRPFPADGARPTARG
jgi:hypothetical protein